MPVKIVRKEEGLRQVVLGDQQQVKLSGADTSGQFAVIMQDLAPGLAVPPHVHSNEDETFHIVEGEVEFTVGTDQHILRAGDLIFLPRHIAHSLKVVSTVPARIRLTIAPAGLEGMFAELGQLPAGPPDLALVGAICGRYGVQFA